MKTLDGKWNYLSFVAKPAEVDRSSLLPKVKEPANLCAEWTPPSVMDFTTDDSGQVTGKARLGPIHFSIAGSVTQPTDESLGGVELSVTVDSLVARHVTGINQEAVYKLAGSFLPNSTHIVGNVVGVSNDLGFMPDGASGPFVLYPVE